MLYEDLHQRDFVQLFSMWTGEARRITLSRRRQMEIMTEIRARLTWDHLEEIGRNSLTVAMMYGLGVWEEWNEALNAQQTPAGLRTGRQIELCELRALRTIERRVNRWVDRFYEDFEITGPEHEGELLGDESVEDLPIEHLLPADAGGDQFREQDQLPGEPQPRYVAGLQEEEAEFSTEGQASPHDIVSTSSSIAQQTRKKQRRTEVENLQLPPVPAPPRRPPQPHIPLDEFLSVYDELDISPWEAIQLEDHIQKCCDILYRHHDTPAEANREWALEIVHPATGLNVRALFFRWDLVPGVLPMDKEEMFPVNGFLPDPATGVVPHQGEGSGPHPVPAVPAFNPFELTPAQYQAIRAEQTKQLPTLHHQFSRPSTASSRPSTASSNVTAPFDAVHLQPQVTLSSSSSSAAVRRPRPIFQQPYTTSSSSSSQPPPQQTSSSSSSFRPVPWLDQSGSEKGKEKDY